MQLEGTIKSVTFHSADSGFSVFRVTVEGEKAPVVVTGYNGAVVVRQKIAFHETK